MLDENQPPWDPGNQYSADYELDGITPDLNVDQTNQIVLFPDQLGLADELILHALGVAWKAQTVPRTRSRLLRTDLVGKLR